MFLEQKGLSYILSIACVQITWQLWHLHLHSHKSFMRLTVVPQFVVFSATNWTKISQRERLMHYTTVLGIHLNIEKSLLY